MTENEEKIGRRKTEEGGGGSVEPPNLAML
jgi:hypothetical protein